MSEDKLNYAASGVDIAEADRAVDRIKKLAKSTFNESVLSEIGSFGGFFRPDMTGMKEPVFISSADGVGTKLKIAFMMDRHDTVGADLINHCVNDILVHGAAPLFFLDYIGTGKVKQETIAEIIEGFAGSCKNHGMALLGGEIAELPDMYAPGEYDLAGFIVGMIDREKIVNGAEIKAGDAVIGLASNGLHTNGYSLARKICFERAGLKPEDKVEGLDGLIGEILLKTHKSYYDIVRKLLDKYNIKGMAHITGGGLSGNLCRVLPESVDAVIEKGTWPVLPIFKFLAEKGPVDDNDMFEAFNMGIGFVLVVDVSKVDTIIADVKNIGDSAYKIGVIEEGNGKVTFKE